MQNMQEDIGHTVIITGCKPPGPGLEMILYLKMPDGFLQIDKLFGFPQKKKVIRFLRMALRLITVNLKRYFTIFIKLEVIIQRV